MVSLRPVFALPPLSSWTVFVHIDKLYSQREVLLVMTNIQSPVFTIMGRNTPLIAVHGKAQGGKNEWDCGEHWVQEWACQCAHPAFHYVLPLNGMYCMQEVWKTTINFQWNPKPDSMAQ